MKKHLLISICLAFSFYLKAQEHEQDTVQTMISTDSQSKQFQMDSLGKVEQYALDIGTTRGLFIRAEDGKMQMRILGSIRFLVVNDLVNFPIKKTFNTYNIPIGEDRISIPNYYASLNESRFGFEVTRKLDNDKKVFIRLEMDFNGGSSGNFRIRHAYGQTGKFIVGQTWSLFSNVTALPATVELKGPVGSVKVRTPQIRYFNSNRKGTRWALALEYSRPDLNLQAFDTIGISTVQLLPDFTARIEREGVFGAVQLSGVLSTISVNTDGNNVTNKIGVGGSLSGIIDLNKSKVLYQLTYGKAISHFINVFDGTGNDALYNPETRNLDPNFSFGGFVAYDFSWSEKLLTNVSLGYAELWNKEESFPQDNYSHSMGVAADSFWTFTEGARLGLEYMYGKRWNIGGDSGNASRISALFYYDF